MSIDQNELEEGLEKVVILRSEDWDEKLPVAELTEGVAPGAEIRWIDDSFTPTEGSSYYYYVSAYTKYGHSEYASAPLKLGKSYNPSDVADITTVINPDKSVDLSWHMSEIGYDGGYVPLDEVRFTVKRVWKPDPADWMTEEKIIAENIECPEMKISNVADDVAEVIELHYQIIASFTDDSGSSSGTSRDIVLGPDYTLPYSDSFFFMPEGSWMTISEKRWMSKGNTNVGKWVSYTNSAGEYVNLKSRHATDEDDSDTWLYFFDPYTDKGISTELTSHRINIKDIENPVMSLWRHAHAGQGGRIEVFIDLPGNPESIKAGEISFYDATDIEDDFRYNLEEDENVVVVNYLSDSKIVAIPEEARLYTVTGVAERPFAGNIEITEVSFPESLTSIGQEAFEGCSSLAKATFVTITPPATGTDAFKNIATDAEGICPMESYEAYSAEENLRPLNFSKCNAVDLVTENQILGEEYYSLDGIRILNPVKGTPALRRILLDNGQVKVEKVILQ